MYKLFVNSVTSISFNSAIFLIVYIMFAGSLVFPLLGTGVKKGESVSDSNLSDGINFTTSESLLFLYVLQNLYYSYT